MNDRISRYQVQEKGRISALQLGLLNMTIIIATADVFLPAFVAQDARQDSWIAVIISTAASLILVNIIITLGLRYPEKTIVQYSSDILGKPLGLLIALTYTFYFLLLAYGVTRELAEIFVISFNPIAPLPFYSIVTVAVSAYAVKKGFEVIARINDLLLPVGLIVLVIITIINIPKMELKHYLPIMYDGIAPSLRGGFLIMAFMLETVTLLQLIPFVKDKENIRKYINASIILVGGGLLMGVLTIAVLGVVLTQKLIFPALQFVRVAEAGPQITNLDISIMVVWISGIFVKITISYYAFVLSLSQIFKFKTYGNMIIPSGLLIIALSIQSSKNIADVIHFIHHTFPVTMLVYGVTIPILLLVVSYLKKGSESSGLQTAKNKKTNI